MALMVGTNTVVMDNPFLNVRYWPGEDPIKIIPDITQRLPETARVFHGKSKTLVFTSLVHKTSTSNPEFVHIPEKEFSVKTMLNELHERKILSMMVEGGSALLNSFINAGLWDEARVFTGKTDFGNGIKAPFISRIAREHIVFHGFDLDIY
jgi:diaminohydroxyphosphoribosylaminopyrimidine deaminase/5-amino-6-(5-phosphoribosylamino)uracil reductase